MTFREFLESTGSISWLAPGQWADMRNAAGIRSNVESGDEFPFRRTRQRSPEAVFGIDAPIRKPKWHATKLQAKSASPPEPGEI